MTYDPDRDAKAPPEVNPNLRPDTREPQGMGMGLWIGILAVLAVVTFLMFNMGRSDRIATDGPPAANAPATTGSGANVPAPAVNDRATGANPAPANPPAAAPR